MLVGGMTDPKGDRSKRPSQQADPDLYTRIVEKRQDGVVIRGAKAHQTGAVNSHEIMIMPTQAMGEGDEAYAIVAAIPLDAPGVTMIFGRQTNEERKFECGIDAGNCEFGMVGGEALVVFEDVFVPWERVFMCGEAEFQRASGRKVRNTSPAELRRLQGWCFRYHYRRERARGAISGHFGRIPY